ncbi:MAG: hypothetical protein ACE5FH_06775 [Candidatus Zixiibacteriota bacterium]
MPCGDITDHLKIQFDSDSRILRYKLRKKSCGGTVGSRAMIGRWIKLRTAEQVLSTTPREIMRLHPQTSDMQEYLVLKHFLAVQAALRMMLGIEPGRASDYCTIDSIEYGPEGTLLQAEIDVNGMTEEIKACNVAIRPVHSDSAHMDIRKP